ncbi:MAG: glycosyltransferase family 2 protein [Gallionellaceae bacterium]|jgi:glycosyltransferase involved in cell wall biosynthesis
MIDTNKIDNALVGGLRFQSEIKQSSPNAPLVTIITVTFNAATHLPKTIQSIRELTYKNIEWIVIDGNSTDQTLELIKANQDVIDYWVSEPDGGIYDAWNKGVAQATGEWIAFLGAGDEYTPDSVADYINAICSLGDELEFISSQIHTVDEYGRILRTWGEPFTWVQHKKYMTIAHVGALHRKRLFEINGQFDTAFKSSADYDFFIRCGDGLKSHYLKQVTASMLTGGVSSGYGGIYETYLIQKKINPTASTRIRYWIACVKRFARSFVRGY